MHKVKNIFCSTNPINLADSLWNLLSLNRDCANTSSCFAGDIIFLPTRRAVRTVEKMFVEKVGSAIMLPRLIALGEGVDEDEEVEQPDVVSNTERAIVLSRMIMAQTGDTMSASLQIARDLVRMTDYLETEQKSADINWPELVGDEFAEHFKDKAKFLDMASSVLPNIFSGRKTASMVRNDEIKSWIKYLSEYVLSNPSARIMVCGSTASVPATRDLMEFVANQETGYILLPGDVSSCAEFENVNTANPYYTIIDFLKRIDFKVSDIEKIDSGKSPIEFINSAFTDNPKSCDIKTIPNFTRIDCVRESEEAEVVAEIVSNSIINNKSVLVVSPDISAAQRLAESFAKRNIEFDFSGGTSGTSTKMGRAILNLLDNEIANSKSESIFYNEYKKEWNLINALSLFIDSSEDIDKKIFTEFECGQIWNAIKELSDILIRYDLKLSLSDLRGVISDCIKGVKIRTIMQDFVSVAVLGTMEARMQSADVIIMTGLNEGMFPAKGYENPWLPRRISEKIGLPPENRKVALMALDFMTLSCGKEVFWTRSQVSGSSETTESRFLSRMSVAASGASKTSIISNGEKWLALARDLDDVEYKPLDISAPRPPAIRDDVHVTSLELLIHNPYAFYVRHILKLKVKLDPDREPDARDFGILVHDTIEKFGHAGKQISAKDILSELDKAAVSKLPTGSVKFYFWHKRFEDMSNYIADMINESLSLSDKDSFSGYEIDGDVAIAGRVVRARADLVFVKNDMGVVVDIKTGGVPNTKQLEQGNMPQLPIEAYMLQSGSFGIQKYVPNVSMRFLQLQNRAVKRIDYADVQMQKMIDATIQKTTELFARYSKDFEPYEYYERNEEKYKAFDELARRD